MFCASGTMGNLLALSVHLRRGDEIILGDKNHVFNYEGGGVSAILGAAFHPVRTLDDGTYDLREVAEGRPRVALALCRIPDGG
jgi:threonine aldolase